MIVQIQFDTDGGAFSENLEGQMDYLLVRAGDRVLSALLSPGVQDSGGLMDSWGNTIGSWEVTSDA